MWLIQKKDQKWNSKLKISPIFDQNRTIECEGLRFISQFSKSNNISSKKTPIFFYKQLMNNWNLKTSALKLKKVNQVFLIINLVLMKFWKYFDEHETQE